MGYSIESLSGQTKYNLSPRNGMPVRYIVVHYTATMASAKNNVIYFSGGNRGASADFFIDDTSIWRFNPNTTKWFSWHCGDGHGQWGITNSNSIGIEVVSDGRDFSDAEIARLSWLVQTLMKEYGIDASHVVRHYDASRKECPAPYIDAKKWAALKARITSSGEWCKDSTGWWYRYSDGSWPKSQWLEIDGAWYYFEASGYAAQNKWLKLKNVWYWFKASCAAAQSECVSPRWGEWYAFDKNCHMITKSIKVNANGDLAL